MAGHAFNAPSGFVADQTEYVGSGETALLIDAMGAIDRDDEDYERWRKGEERRQLDELDDELGRLGSEAREAARDALAAAGYHQHKRGTWRRRREPRHGESQNLTSGRWIAGQPTGSSIGRPARKATKRSRTTYESSCARLPPSSPAPRRARSSGYWRRAGATRLVRLADARSPVRRPVRGIKQPDADPIGTRPAADRPHAPTESPPHCARWRPCGGWPYRCFS